MVALILKTKTGSVHSFQLKDAKYLHFYQREEMQNNKNAESALQDEAVKSFELAYLIPTIC